MGRRQQNTSKLGELWLLTKRTRDYGAGNCADVRWDGIYRHCEYYFFLIRIKVLGRPIYVRPSSFDAKHRATIINGTDNKTDSTGIQLCMRPEYYPTAKPIEQPNYKFRLRKYDTNKIKSVDVRRQSCTASGLLLYWNPAIPAKPNILSTCQTTFWY